MHPDGIGEMVNRDIGPDVASDERIDDLAVARERCFVDLIALGLDARPLDAETVCVEPQALEKGDVVEQLGPAARRVAYEGGTARAQRGSVAYDETLKKLVG